MTELDDEQRRHYAHEILNNPLFKLVMNEMEAAALNRGLAAKVTDHPAQSAALADIRAIRSFRQNCEAMLRNTPPVKAAPA